MKKENHLSNFFPYLPHLNPAKAKSKNIPPIYSMHEDIIPLGSCQGKRQSCLTATCFRHGGKGGLHPLL